MLQINFIGYLRHKEYTCISPVHLPVHPIIFLFYQEELPSTWPSMTHLLSYLALLTPESGTVPEFPSPCDEKIMSMCQMEKIVFFYFSVFFRSTTIWNHRAANWCRILISCLIWASDDFILSNKIYQWKLSHLQAGTNWTYLTCCLFSSTNALSAFRTSLGCMSSPVSDFTDLGVWAVSPLPVTFSISSSISSSSPSSSFESVPINHVIIFVLSLLNTICVLKSK